MRVADLKLVAYIMWSMKILICVCALIFALPLRQLSHSAGANTSKTLEDSIMGFYDENRIKIAYYDQCRYISSNPSDNEDKGMMSLVETLKGDDDDDVMRPHVLGFGHETEVYDMVCNDWSIYHKKKNQLDIRLDSCYMIVDVLWLIFMISTTMTNLLVIMHLLGLRHVILH